MEKKPRDSFLLRPILPIVLYTGQMPWRTVKTLHELLVEPEAFRIHVPNWAPLYWQVAEHSTEELLKAQQDAFVQVLALFRVEKAEQTTAEQVFRQVMERLGPLFDLNRARWEHLVRFMLGWASHKRPVQERPSWHTLTIQAQTDELRKERAKMQIITIADEIRNEGIAVGKAQGIAEGEAKGKIEGLAGALLQLGRKKCGEPDAATLQAIQAITDVARLTRMIDVVMDLASWADLLNVP